MLILINGTNIVRPTKRLWAHAHWGKKFVRLGATRISATVQSSGMAMNVTAFENSDDGSVAVQLINNSNRTERVELKMPKAKGCSVEAYLTNDNNDLTAVGVTRSRGGMVKARMPKQSLLSLYLTK